MFTWMKEFFAPELDPRDVARLARRLDSRGFPPESARPRRRVTVFGVLMALFLAGCAVWFLGTIVRILDSSGAI